MTVVVERKMELAVPPATVWRLLTDFAQHARWHPYYRLIGEAQAGPIEFTYSMWAAPNRVMRAPARITRLEPNRLFEWQRGPWPLSRVTETYTLVLSGSGTLVTHRMEHIGLVARLARRRVERDAQRTVERTDAAIAEHLARLRAAPLARTKTSSPAKRRWR